MHISNELESVLPERIYNQSNFAPLAPDLQLGVVMATRLINLTGGSPWGFTLSGGKEFGAHLKISKASVCSFVTEY